MTTKRTWTRNPAAAEEGRRRRIELREFLIEFSSREMVAPTRLEIAEHLDISEKTVTKHVHLAMDEGLIEDLGGTRGLRAI